jgi:hypothetical protein
MSGLSVSIVDDALVISIGLDALKTAIENNPSYPLDKVTVTDIHAIAKEIVSELNREEEDGSTPVHRMLDRAFDNAIEQGAEGVEITTNGDGS